MSTADRRRTLARTLILAFTLILAVGCKDDKDEKSARTPTVEGTTQPDPAALRSTVDQAVTERLAGVEASRTGDPDHGDTARLRTMEARLARFDERIDTLERKATLDRKDDPALDRDGPDGADSGRHAPPTVEPEPEPEPEPVLEPDVVEAPAEDVVEAPVEADVEPELGFTPAPPVEPKDGKDPVEPTLILTRAAVAPSIDRESREPVDSGTHFDASVGKLYAFMIFKNPTEEEQRVTVVWNKDGKELSRLDDLKVGPKASRWRTWANITINERRRGDWAVEVLGPADALLGTLRFKVE